MKLLLELSVGEHCAETRTLAKEKLRLVDKKIADLRGIESALNKLIRACARSTGGQGCPIIENLCKE